MKPKLLVSVAFMAGFVLVGVPVLAHHGATAYDMKAPLVFKGAMVTKYSWINPHVLIIFDYRDEQGNVQHWTTEIGSPGAVTLMGWSRTSLKPGDVVTVYVWRSKTGQPVGRLNKVMLADGTLLRDSQTGADNGGRADNDVR